MHMMTTYGPVAAGIMMTCLIVFGRRWGAVGAAVGTVICVVTPMIVEGSVPVRSGAEHLIAVRDLNCMVAGLLLAMAIVWAHDPQGLPKRAD